MTGRTVGVGLVIAVAACSETAPPPSGADVDGRSIFRAGLHHPGVFDGPAPANLFGVRWTFRTGGTVRGTPAVAGNRIYVGSGDGRLYALDRDTGAEIWRLDAGSPVQCVPAVEGGRVFFTTRSGSVLAVSASDGAVLWRVETGALIPFPWGREGWDYWTGSPTVVGGRVIVGSGDGVVRALDAGTGAELWQVSTGGRIRATPAVREDLVVIGSFDGKLYALNLEDGAVRWTFATEGASMESSEWGFDRRSIQSSAAVVDGTVYVGARDANLYAVDLASGQERWRTNDNTAWVISSPAVHEGVVYSATSSSAISYAVDAATGEELWRTRMGGPVFGSPAVVGETVVTTDLGGWISVLDRTDGTVLWRYRTGGAIKSSPVVVDGIVYTGSDDGRVWALESGTAPTPRRAVFWDEDLGAFSTVGRHETVMEHFRFRGYEVLDAEGLATFLEERVADGTRSVVVFAQDWLPDGVAPDRDSTGEGGAATDAGAGVDPPDAAVSLFRRYLEAGGKVVWLGYPPLAIGRDSEGGFVDFDLDRASTLLGVTYDSNGDDYGVRATDEGRAWGLPAWWTAFGGIDPAGPSRVLALDENGRASAWVQEYGGPEGTGFVYLQGRLTRTDLDAVARVAEYGITCCR